LLLVVFSQMHISLQQFSLIDMAMVEPRLCLYVSKLGLMLRIYSFKEYVPSVAMVCYRTRVPQCSSGMCPVSVTGRSVSLHFRAQPHPGMCSPEYTDVATAGGSAALGPESFISHVACQIVRQHPLSSLQPGPCTNGLQNKPTVTHFKHSHSLDRAAGMAIMRIHRLGCVNTSRSITQRGVPTPPPPLPAHAHHYRAGGDVETRSASRPWHL
jgi:hypothetical protein